MDIGSFKRLSLLFQGYGFSLYLVGGPVRDMYLSRSNGVTSILMDMDMTTDATPDEIIHLLSELGVTYGTKGMAYGTIDFRYERIHCEVTTMRLEFDYDDGRHPKGLHFTTNIHDDLKRRDFTMNAMALSRDGMLIDPFNGRDDLDKCVLRVVGEAQSRLMEDRLRILRAYRFATCLSLTFDENLECAIVDIARTVEPNSLLDGISKERIRSELEKIITSEHAVIGLGLMAKHGLIRPSESVGSGIWMQEVFELLANPNGIGALTHHWKSMDAENRSFIGWMLIGTCRGPWDGTDLSGIESMESAMAHSTDVFRLSKAYNNKLKRLQNAMDCIPDEGTYHFPEEISTWWGRQRMAWFQAVLHLRKGETGLLIDLMVLKTIVSTASEHGCIGEGRGGEGRAMIQHVSDMKSFLSEWFEHYPAHLSEVRTNSESSADPDSLKSRKMTLMKEIWESGGGKSK